MRFTEVVLCSNNEISQSNTEWSRNGLQTNEINSQIKETSEGNQNHNTTIEYEEIRSSQTHSTVNSSNSLDLVGSPADESSLLSASTICPAPLCRKFWKSGNYEVGQMPNLDTGNQNLKNHMCVHPMFLHSNATSHKWAFGAFAELLDNVVDEIPNGATFAYIDKIVNPKDGSPALLIQDDGGGMDPEVIRHCMSFGFSDKPKKCVIGQYGNGFKTSSMRLGADVIVFSRHTKESMVTQSIGLLSFSLLTRMGYDRIVVPMVDYEFSPSTTTFKPKLAQGKEKFSSNLSLMLEWSPYKTEEEMLKQFDDIGNHGTKIIIYNLWLNDDGDMELDFDSDSKDIHITGDPNIFRAAGCWKQSYDQHIAYRYQYSLRAYLSILYLRLPEYFNILLRGEVVQHHNIADDLKFPEFILYRPLTGKAVEAAVVTTIGFLKEAPDINVHGFNIYCRNRLILPFWQTFRVARSKGRGVVGILEANYIEPTHNKQDFEKTSLFQKLEDRLKQMTLEYWRLHCELIGYQSTGKNHAALPSRYSRSSCPAVRSGQDYVASTPVNTESSNKYPDMYQNKSEAKRKEYDSPAEVGHVKRHEGSNSCTNDTQFCMEQPEDHIKHGIYDQETINLMKQNKTLRSRVMEFDKKETELNLKVQQLAMELKEVQSHYMNLLAEWESMNIVKMDLDI